jgi:DNA-binding response OmpR family regulator
MKILLIKSDRPIPSFVCVILSDHHYSVDIVTQCSSEFELSAQLDYDLILLDRIEMCRHLRHQGYETPILMLAMEASNDEVIAGLDAGADDYIVLSSAACQLIARIRALLRRKNTSFSSSFLWGQLCLNPTFAQVTYFQQEVSLRPKEYNLLALFLRHPNRVFSRSAIIHHLWSIDDSPVEGSVTNLIKDLRQRLKSAGLEEDVIETVYGLGYRLRQAPASELESKAREFRLRSRAS